MLLSPGHSPRVLSSPSPSLAEKTLDNNPGSSIRNPKKHQSNNVLDEDTYVASIEKIIERDFFPDIPKLRDRLDWLEAVRTGDPVMIRDAQLKIIERRTGKAPNRDSTGKSRTPGSTFFRKTTPLELDRTDRTDRTPVVETEEFDTLYEETDGSIDGKLSLDEFFRRYTSEDNDSFNKIMEKVNRKRKERYDFLLEGEKEKEEGRAIEDVKRDRITDGYGSSDQPVSTLESWKYTANNLLMYNPSNQSELALTEDEREVRLKALTREINRPNTRFHGKMLDSRPKEEDTVAVLYTPVPGATPVAIPFARDMDKMKKYDLEDLRKTPNQFYVESEKKADNGYRYVKTPSPAPGVDNSPFMTWGDIEGTPLRLEQEDTPIGIGGSSDGPHFNIPMPPSRDEKAHSLSRDAARKLRERSKMFQKPPLPSPVRGGSASPSARTFSPAAQKFMRNAIAKSSRTVDESLRASYRGASPGAVTPKMGRSVSRLGRDGSVDSRSPSVKDVANPPW